MARHLDEMPTAGQSAEVAQEDERGGFTLEAAQGDVAALRREEGQVWYVVSGSEHERPAMIARSPRCNAGCFGS